MKNTDDNLNMRIQNILEEFNMNLPDLINVINIYCNNLTDLKEEQTSNNYRYTVSKISDGKWAIVDKNNMVIQTIVNDELLAYRKAKIFSTTKVSKEINLSQKGKLDSII